MDLTLNSEQEQIVDSTAAFLRARLPVTRLHGRDGGAHRVDGELWRQISEMGWLAMTLGVAAGGVGYSAVEEALVFRELGRQCAPARILFTALAAKAAEAAGENTLAARFAAGEAVAAYAAQDDFSADPASLHRRRLYDHAGADFALALDGDRLRIVELAPCDLRERSALDKSVSMSVGDLSGAPIACEVRAPAVRQAASLLLAAEFTGMAEAVRDMIVEYAKIRETFGRPIGAYQAVRHPCAEMAVRCEASRSQLFYAALVLAESARSDARDPDLHVSSARILSEQAAVKNCDDNIQLHGGIGVTDEFTAHFYLKRTHTMSRWFAVQRDHLRRVLNAPMTPF